MGACPQALLLDADGFLRRVDLTPFGVLLNLHLVADERHFFTAIAIPSDC